MQVVDKWRYTSEENSEREIRILSRVSHENCIKMHAVYVTTRRVYIVTELVTGGELLDKCALPLIAPPCVCHWFLPRYARACPRPLLASSMRARLCCFV